MHLAAVSCHTAAAADCVTLTLAVAAQHGFRALALAALQLLHAQGQLRPSSTHKALQHPLPSGLWAPTGEHLEGLAVACGPF